ncbi:MFS transporter [Saccharothrix variisporea]|uniref:Putative proline/betaine transporter n=1 Tax=Saccharothrix variisporea TaxID=543527 RepID=A0A495X9J6_9PSEU|nr:MFS transporter [Saccharothrix variisporea]RKT71151.1 putative MFS family arabinose efflux permease [Saccharothrix variisporea]
MTAGGGRVDPGTGRVAVASFVGTAIEFYDFYLYGTAAALVLNSAFFPTLSPVAGSLAAFSTFAVAFVARPLGALLFGHLGDRRGRKSTLVASLLVMGCATVAIGLLPGYDAIGVAAPVALTALRFLQGLGLGGEWGGAALLANECAPPGRKGWYSTFPQVGPAVGFALASGSFLVLSTALSDDAFRDWGWRVPFLASAVLVLVGLRVRLTIAETPEFARLTAQRERSSKPLLDMLREAPARLFGAGGTIVVCYVLFYVATTFGLAYATKTLGRPRGDVLLDQIAAVGAMALTTVVACRAADRFGRKPVLVTGCLAAIAAGVTLPGGHPVFALAAMGWVYGPLGAFLPELFPARFRYSASSFAYTLGGVLGGALAPTLATHLVSAHGTGAIGWYVAAAAAVSVACVLLLPETYKARSGPRSVRL